MQLEGKVALVTGGGTGIGAAVAQRFVAEGAKVCITGRRQEMLEKVAAPLPAGSVTICPGDVCKEGTPEQMVQKALAINGRLDILVNAAATGEGGGILEIQAQRWREILKTNLTGPFLMMKAALPHLIAGGGGCIINVASLAGVRAVPGNPGYCATKAGLIHLTKQIALDFGKDNIRCNVVCPGPVRTAMLESNFAETVKVKGTTMDEIFEQLPQNVPLRKVASPADIAGLFVFLASDDSCFMTGDTILADGGIHIVDSFAASVGQLGLNWG
jgi:meso-butanediol dehydrogenase / (S,S)-butanediol dehydrogenase / diacetyl reductase